MNRRQTGFTLIELLIVVAIIGIIAAIAIPNLLNVVDRGKQKKTLADIRAIGNAMQTYALDRNYFPRGFGTLTNLDQVAAHLEPDYMQRVPVTDGWGWPLLYASTATGSGYTLRSPGKDGSTQQVYGDTTDFDCDIIFENGSFTAKPEGKQQ